MWTSPVPSLGRDELGLEHAVRVLVAQRSRRTAACTSGPTQVAALEPLDDARLGVGLGVAEQVPGVGREPRLADDVALGACRWHVGLDDDVVDVGADHDPRGWPAGSTASSSRRAPARRSPAAADRDGRVLAHLVDVVVHPQLVVGQRRLVVPAVGQHAEALVDQALVVQRLERPDDRLHVVGVERLVVVVEVDPAGLAGDVVAPLPRVLQHRLAALGVELLDADLEDLVLGLDAELGHRLELGGQAVGVPPEPALDPAAAHRLVARDEVLDVAGQQVAVVRQAVGERRPVVEDELVVAVGAGRPVLAPRRRRCRPRPST